MNEKNLGDFLVAVVILTLCVMVIYFGCFELFDY